MSKQNFTREEVIAIVLEERQRAVEIAYEFKKENEKKYQSMKSAGSKIASIWKNVADECRLVGNAISGGNALSATLGETMEDRIKKSFEEKY